MKLNKIARVIFTLSVILLLIAPSCKKYADIPPFFEENEDTVRLVTRKVLIIGIDGGVGSEYKAIAPPVLTSLQEHSKFSWEGISDESTTDAASWKTLMSGISFSRHQIQDSLFVFSQPSGGSQHVAPSSFPSFFSYILGSARSDLKTSFITSWPTLLNRLVPEVEDRTLAASDAAVKDSAIVRLKNVKSDLVVVHFNSVAIAGKEHGFSAGSAGYKDAVLKVDGYVGELMNALKARPEYNKNEEWLVIITSTHGGEGNSYGGPSEKETNTFSFYYNENMKKTELIKGGVFSGVQIKGRDGATIKAEVLNDGGIYDAGTGEQTIQIKIKGSGPGAYPHFFSKMSRWSTTPGWSMFTNGSKWAISIRSETSGEKRIQAETGNIFNNQWHTLTVVIYDSAGGRFVKRFTDDRRILDVASTVTLGANFGNIASPAPLMLGWGSDPTMGAVSFYSSDISIFNTALSDEEVVSNLCLSDITQHPKYDRLIGYWPGNDGFGARFKNKIAGNKDFILQGAYQWTGVPELPCTTVPNTTPNTTSLFVKGVDLAPTVFYWLRIPTATSWGFEGNAWLSQYETEFVKL